MLPSFDQVLSDQAEDHQTRMERGEKPYTNQTFHSAEITAYPKSADLQATPNDLSL